MKQATKLPGLRTKITGIIIMATAIAVASIALLSFQREQESFRTALQQQAEALLAVLTETSDNALLTLNVDTIQLLTESTVESDAVQAVRFYDGEGRLIADSNGSRILTFNTNIDALGVELIESDSIIFDWRDGYLFAGQRVQIGNQIPGAVTIELSTEILLENITNAQTQATLISVVVIIFAVGLAFILSKSIVDPLLHVVDAAEKISQGEYQQRVTVNTNDELQTLATAFNTMSASIQKTTDELRASRDEALEAQQLAQESSRLKSEFLSTMSHELRTPLNAIEGFTSIMLGGMGIELSPKAEKMVQRISANSSRLLDLINDFLDLSRIESGRLELVSEPISPRELVQTWQQSVGVLAEEKQVEFVVNVDDNLPDKINGDEDALTKIGINLLSNAFKFTHEGSVTLSLTYLDDEWSISVKDTGIGIPLHAQNYIFEEFRQVDGSSKREYGGTGLGLALVQKLARAMNGTVVLDSEAGVGSIFTVTLPLITDPETQGA